MEENTVTINMNHEIEQSEEEDFRHPSDPIPSTSLSYPHFLPLNLFSLSQNGSHSWYVIFEEYLQMQLDTIRHQYVYEQAGNYRQLSNSIIWDQWICCLAKNLTYEQWESYWVNYLALYGTSNLPEHIISTFNYALEQYQNLTKWLDERQQYYG
ncbi:unnamed protein product [Dracunculus medinensis]|uniref:BUB1 N-terminal domain-containing protein n=1 Tax=Dracunculus medinensis TaxID=318479 RepID=A0A0N4UJC3_DRAME|nr:unnamed protein product [Dracunculus medinensis]